MATPQYAPPQRQQSQVLRTDDEVRQQYRDWVNQQRDMRQAAQAAANGPVDPFRPNTAQLMAATGATSQQANDIIRWDDYMNYMPEGGWLDTVSAQNLINSPDANLPEFQFKWTEPETPGELFLRMKEKDGGWDATSLGFRSGSDQSGRAPLGTGRSKSQIYEEAMGTGVGTAGLDAFARQQGAADWASFDWDGFGSKLSAGAVTPSTYTGNYEVWGADRPRYFENGQDMGFRRDLPGFNGYATPEQRALDAASTKAITDWRTGQAQGAADFGRTMELRQGDVTRNDQAFQQQMGGGFQGGVLNDSYSNPFFGQITGREASGNPFSMQAGQYPWSSPTQQLDISSLMAPGYGGPQGGGSLGSYGGPQGGFGGLGGLGGHSPKQEGGASWGGPFGAKSPWSVS